MAHYQYNGKHFELPDGLTNDQAILKIKTHLGEQTKAVIPGHQTDEERQVMAQQYDASKQAEIKAAGGKLNYGLKGTGEAALSMLSQIPAQAVAVGALGLHGLGKMFGVYDKKEDSFQAASNIANRMIYEPKSEVGQDYTNAAGEFMNRYVLPFGPGGQAKGFTKNQRLAIQDKYGKPGKPVVSVDAAEAVLSKKPETTVPPKTTVASLPPEIVEGQRNLNAMAQAERVQPVQPETINRGDLTNQQALPFDNEIPSRPLENQMDMFHENSLPPETPKPLTSNGTGVIDGNYGGQVELPFARQYPRENIQVVQQPSIQSAADKIAAGQRFNLTAEERIAWEKTHPEIALAEDGYTPMDPKTQFNMMQDVKGSAEFIQKQREIDAAFSERQADIEQRFQGFQKEMLLEKAKEERQVALETLEQQLRDSAYKPTGDGQGPKTRAAKATQVNKFGQGGAIDPRVFEDLYNFGKSVVRTAEGVLMPLYHGTGEVFDSIKSSVEGGALGNGVYLAVRPEYASGYAEGKAPNVHQVYANITKPLEIKGPGDPMVNALISLGKTREQANRIVEKAYDDKGYITNEVRNLARKQGYDGIFQYRGDKLSEIVAFDSSQVKSAISGDNKTPRVTKFGQGGSAPMLNDIAQGIVKLGEGIKAVFTGEKTVEPSSVLKPTTPEDIAAKQVLASKAKAIGAKDSVYIAPATIEEVRANPGKDITSVAQDLTPGSYAVLRKNQGNNLLSFVNRQFTTARLNKLKDSMALITGQDGLNKAYKKLTPDERMSVHNVAIAMDRKGLDWSPEMAEQLGFSPAQVEFMTKRAAAFDHIGGVADNTLGKLGMKLLNRRLGYAPANFESKYTSLVVQVKPGKDGKSSFSVVGVLNAKSDWEHSVAVKWAKDKFGDQIKSGEYQIIQKERKGLNDETSRFKQMDDSSRMMSLLAEHVPEVADLKGQLDAFIENQTKNLYSHNVHELHKKGVFGSIGDRPWLDAKRNAEDFFKGEINHIENALSYWHYQDAVATTRKAVADESIQGMDKTKSYLNRYLDTNFQGGLNGLGSLSNSLVDVAYQGIQKTASGVNRAFGAEKGWSPDDNPNLHLGNIRDVASAWMMGWINPAFTAIQITQLATGALPEVLRIRSEFGIAPTKVASALSNATLGNGIIYAADQLGKLDNVRKQGLVPEHLIDAWEWAKKHGITEYNEIEQSHTVDHPAWTKVKAVATSPAAIGEKLSTPPAYLAIVDMLYEGGLRGENLHLAAYDALKYAMTEYHHDAAPMLHTRSGIVGQAAGGLKKYVHNAVDQQISRTMEASRHPAAFATTWGTFLFFAGTSGILGYNVANSLSMATTDQGLEQHWNSMFGKGVHSQGILHGYASALSEWDLQTRYSMADALPSNAGEALAGPHLTRLMQTVAAGYTYAKTKDESSFLELAKTLVPAGPGVGMLDQAINVDEGGNVLNKTGDRKYPPDFARTSGEQTMRKITGIRPIRERLFDEQNYTNALIDKKYMKARSDAKERMQAAMYRNDPEGFDKAWEKYLKYEGQPEQLSKIIQEYAKNKTMDERQRKAGIAPKKNIDRWERYNQ